MITSENVSENEVLDWKDSTTYAIDYSGGGGGVGECCAIEPWRL